jgi:hypothetical protein
MALGDLHRPPWRATVGEMDPGVAEVADVVADRGALQAEQISDFVERAPFLPELDEFVVALGFRRLRFAWSKFRRRQWPD